MFVYYVDIFFILGVYINVGIWFEFFLNVLKCFIVMKLMVDYIKKCFVFFGKLIYIIWYDKKKFCCDFIYFI